MPRHRAIAALGLAARADGGAQIHQPLRVGRHIGGVVRQQLFGQRPQTAFERGGFRVAVLGENAAQHAFHIAVQYGFARVKGKGGYSGGRAAPHAFEPLPFFARLREFSAEFVHDLLRGGMQVAGAAVIAQPRPQG